MHIASYEYEKEFDIYHYNLLAAVSLPEFRDNNSYVVDYFIRTLGDVLNNYMDVDSNLFYEYVSSDINEYTNKLSLLTKRIFNLINLFSNQSEIKKPNNPINFTDAMNLLSKKAKLQIKKETEVIYSTEIEKYSDLTKIISFVINKFPSSVIFFPFYALNRVFFSFNSTRLLYSLTNPNVCPSFLNFNGLLFFIFQPFIPEEEKMQIKEEIIKIEKERLKEVEKRKDEINSLEISLLEGEVNGLLKQKEDALVDFSEEIKNEEGIFNDIFMIELILSFVKKVICYKYKPNNTKIFHLLFPYKNTLMNIFIKTQSHFVCKEICKCIILFLRNKIPMIPQINMVCLECRNKEEFHNKNRLFFKDTLIIQLIKEGYFHNLIGETIFTTCGCNAFIFKEVLHKKFIYLEVNPVSEIEEEDQSIFRKRDYNYNDMTDDNIFVKCEITKNFLNLMKYYFYVSVNTDISIIHYSTTHIIINILRSGKLWYVYEMIAYVKRYLYDLLFKCWCDDLDGINNHFEPFLVQIYKTIDYLLMHYMRLKEEIKNLYSLEFQFYSEFSDLFSDWYNDNWITLRLGYLNRLIKKDHLNYFNKIQLDQWKEEVLSEPFMRYISYCICDNLPENDFL